MASPSWFFKLVLIVAIASAAANLEDDEAIQLTFGSVVKLKHRDTNYRLHSDSVTWGTGSGQQIVSAISDSDDPNTYWQIKSAHGSVPLATGYHVHCGDIISLEHLNTKKNLHSHGIVAPLSSYAQEVSAFGEDGQGDKSDNWKIVCMNQGAGAAWVRGGTVQLLHTATDHLLSSDFNAHFNCNCAVDGQQEVVTRKGVVGAGADLNSLWIADDGIYFVAQPDPR